MVAISAGYEPLSHLYAEGAGPEPEMGFMRHVSSTRKAGLGYLQHVGGWPATVAAHGFQSGVGHVKRLLEAFCLEVLLHLGLSVLHESKLAIALGRITVCVVALCTPVMYDEAHLSV